MFVASRVIQRKSQFLAFDFQKPSPQGEQKECGLCTAALREFLMTKSQDTTPNLHMDKDFQESVKCM